MRFLLFTLAASVSLFLHAPPTYARDAVVHITFTDDFAIDEDVNLFFETVYSQALPDHDFLEVKVRVPRFLLLSDSRYRAKFQQALNEKLRPDHVITHLAISVHGKTQEKGGQHRTSLQFIGKIGSDGLDHETRDFFSPLVGHFSKDARIYLNSCSTFCGPQNEVAERATRLMEYLQIPDGQIYGAEVGVTSPVRPGTFVRRNRYFIRKPSFYVVLAEISFLLGGLEGIVGSALDLHLYSWQTGFFLTAAENFALFSAMFPILRDRAWISSEREALEREVSGKILTFRGGVIESVTPVNDRRDLDLIMGLTPIAGSCEKAFST